MDKIQGTGNKKQVVMDKIQGTRNKKQVVGYTCTLYLVSFPLNLFRCYFPTRCDKIIPVATAAFKDSALPIFGIVIF
jgi:hypothetical protein